MHTTHRKYLQPTGTLGVQSFPQNGGQLVNKQQDDYQDQFVTLAPNGQQQQDQWNQGADDFVYDYNQSNNQQPNVQQQSGQTVTAIAPQVDPTQVPNDYGQQAQWNQGSQDFNYDSQLSGQNGQHVNVEGQQHDTAQLNGLLAQIPKYESRNDYLERKYTEFRNSLG